MISFFEEKAKKSENAGVKHGSEKYMKLYNHLYKDTINEKYDEFLEDVNNMENRRFAFQALDVLLME